MTRYLIIGNGVAGTTAAEQIRKNDAAGEIAILTEESLPFYYRIRLNDYLAGEISADDLLAKKKSWYQEQGISLHTSTKATAVDTRQKKVVTDTEKSFFYDRLLIATGSHSFVPPIAGVDKTGVFTLRDIRDADAIASYCRTLTNVVLIGGGLLGLELGNALRKLGKTIAVVEVFPRLLPKQLDQKGAAILHQIMESMGFSFRLGTGTTEIIGADKVTGVRLESGETLPAEMVIISAGVRANLELAKMLGLDYDKGIAIDENMKSSEADIFAAGDVAEFKGSPPYGIWPAAMQQGKVAGTVMAGGSMRYQGTTMSNRLKVAGVDVASAGEIDVDNRHASRIRFHDNEYRKIVLHENRIIGCIMVGNTTDFSKISRAINDKADISELHGILPLENKN